MGITSKASIYVLVALTGAALIVDFTYLDDNTISHVLALNHFVAIIGLMVLTAVLFISYEQGRVRREAEAAAADVAARSRPCPTCAETILKAAKKCKHCGTAISEQ